MQADKTIIERYWNGVIGTADEDMEEILHAIIDDVRMAYVGAMKADGIPQLKILSIEATVSDHVINTY